MRSLELSEFILTRLDGTGGQPHDDTPIRRSAHARNRETPLHRQIYRIVRSAILEQRLLPGARLPSSRDLSADLGLSRNTVIAALNELLAEGYLVAIRGSGTYVVDSLPDAARAEALERSPGGTTPAGGRSLSAGAVCPRAASY